MIVSYPRVPLETRRLSRQTGTETSPELSDAPDGPEYSSTTLRAPNRIERNRGSGLAAKADFATGEYAHWVAVGDLNGDGKQDVVTACSNGVTVLLNTTKPTIASLSPTSSKPGITLTIIGSPAGWSFGASRGTSKVYFGTKAATKYVSWSKYKIKVRVPAMAKGRKAVTVRTRAGKSNVKYFTVI